MSTGPDRVSQAVIGACRIVVGLLWLTNAGWKRCHRPSASGATATSSAAPPTPPSTSRCSFRSPGWSSTSSCRTSGFFGWIVLLVEEYALGAFLHLWHHRRGCGPSSGPWPALVITLSVVRLRGEWPWSYYLMIVANLLVFATAAGRYYGIDGVVRPALEQYI